jgi:hypothetical protein
LRRRILLLFLTLTHFFFLFFLRWTFLLLLLLLNHLLIFLLLWRFFIQLLRFRSFDILKRLWFLLFFFLIMFRFFVLLMFLYIHLDIFLIWFLTFFNNFNGLYLWELLRLFNTAPLRSWLLFRNHFLTHLRLSRFSGLPSLRFYRFLSNRCPSNWSCSSSSASSTSSCSAFDSSFVWTFCYLTTFSITNFTSCRASSSATSTSCGLRFWLSTFTCSTWNLNYDVFFKFSLTFYLLTLWRRLALNNFFANRRFRLIFGLYFFFLLLRGFLVFLWF